MIYSLLAGLLVAFAAPLLYRWMGKYVVLPMTLLPLVLFVYMLTLLPGVLAGQNIMQQYSWVPSLGINLQFYLDGLALFFALLITGFGALIMLYAGGYLKGHPQLGRFYLYLALFMTSMLGVVTSDNIFCLFVFWELTSISSYLLIGFKHEKGASRTSAWQALLVTNAGGLALMAGLILLSMGAGDYTFTGLTAAGNSLLSHPLYLPAVLLVLAGCFAKSAQFPFHFWLPNAMAAPTPVSAYLHSATMVKAGIYLIARLTPALGGTPVWNYTLLTVGGITAVLGAVLALQHKDLKAILAYTTISALGLMVLLLGIGTDLALKAMLVFLLSHALYKGTLFMVAGTVDRSTGTRDLTFLQGLGRQMRPLAIAASLAALSMAGVLPLFGFIGKEMLYEATLGSKTAVAASFSVAFFTGMVFVAVALVMGYQLFWKKTPSPTPLKHPSGTALYGPPLLLGLAGVAFGLFPGALVSPVLGRAVQSITADSAQEMELALWHGFTPVLGLSVLTLVLGYGLFRLLPRLRSFAPRLGVIYRFGPDNIYHVAFNGFLEGATVFISRMQNGYLRSYVITIMFTFVSLVLYVLWKEALTLDLRQRAHELLDVPLYEFILSGLVVGALLHLLSTRSRLTSVVVMGLIGYAAALVYIFFGAPDVAATQLLIETLTVVIFVLLLHKMPAFSYLSHKLRKFRFITFSVLFGVTMTYVLLLVQQHTVDSRLQGFYGEKSLVEAHGRNIVNVILVDFRGLDTMGEITVLAVAGLGIYALLRLRLEKGRKS